MHGKEYDQDDNRKAGNRRRHQEQWTGCHSTKEFDDRSEAEALIDRLPLSGENLMDHQFIPVGPLAPLGALLAQAS